MQSRVLRVLPPAEAEHALLEVLSTTPPFETLTRTAKFRAAFRFLDIGTVPFHLCSFIARLFLDDWSHDIQQGCTPCLTTETGCADFSNGLSVAELKQLLPWISPECAPTILFAAVACKI